MYFVGRVACFLLTDVQSTYSFSQIILQLDTYPLISIIANHPIIIEEMPSLFSLKCNQCNHIINLSSSTNSSNQLISALNNNLFLGGIDSFTPSIISGYNITAVVSVLDHDTYKSYCIQKKLNRFNIKQHLWVEFEDDVDVNVLGRLGQSHEFIQEALNQHNVLVHCQMGVSRSATFVVAFLMKKLAMTYEQAFELVNQRRPISPNAGFRQALLNYEKIISVK